MLCKFCCALCAVRCVIFDFDGFALRAHAQTIFTQHRSIVRITFPCDSFADALRSEFASKNEFVILSGWGFADAIDNSNVNANALLHNTENDFALLMHNGNYALFEFE